MSVLQQFKCPCCDGAIEFDSTVQKMKCPYCGTEFEMEALLAYDDALNQPQDSMAWDTSAGSEWQEGETEGLRIYTCQTCGGEIVADDTAGATECPYCGNPVVMTGQFTGDLKPDLVIPFKLDKKAAIGKLQELYKGKLLLPKVFKDQNHIQEVKGLYVPVWLFDTDAHAHVRYKASTVRTWSDSDYIGFADVPVDGSTKMDDTLMESIEPFDLSAAVDFQTAYLSGYLADKYDVDADESVQRANERIRRSTEEAFAATVQGYATVTPTATSIRLQNGRARYALLPVWILNTQWNGQKFTFAINGQTGKIAGDLPLDVVALWKWLIGVSTAATAAAFALSYLLWML